MCTHSSTGGMERVVLLTGSIRNEFVAPLAQPQGSDILYGPRATLSGDPNAGRIVPSAELGLLRLQRHALDLVKRCRDPGVDRVGRLLIGLGDHLGQLAHVAQRTIKGRLRQIGLLRSDILR